MGGSFGCSCRIIKMRVAIACFLLSFMFFCRAEEQCSDEIAAQCPDLDGGSPVYISDPDDCSKFCECSAHIAWAGHCADGLLWNDVTHVCDWANNVDCGSRPIPEPPVSDSPDYDF